MNKSLSNIENDLLAIYKCIYKRLTEKPYFGDITLKFQNSKFCGMKFGDNLTPGDVIKIFNEKK